MMCVDFFSSSIDMSALTGEVICHKSVLYMNLASFNSLSYAIIIRLLLTQIDILPSYSLTIVD